MSNPRTIVVQLRNAHWEVFEGEGVQPRYADKASAISYARQRGQTGGARIEVRDRDGRVTEVIVA